MLVGAKVCDLTEDLLWFVCGLYVGILTPPLTAIGVPFFFFFYYSRLHNRICSSSLHSINVIEIYIECV